jgi:endogenous inhibitor of DNA gyrase (YacG/DUF329 family)
MNPKAQKAFTRKAVNCPYCKKEKSSLENGLWPFCSQRCQTADIGNWASESYRISGEDSSSAEEEVLGELSSNGEDYS